MKTASSDKPSTDRSRSLGQLRAKSVVPEEAPDRVGERHRVSGRDEQAVLSVAHDLRHTAHSRGDNGTADRERLDDRVGKVLPGRREQRSVGRTEEAEHRLTRNAPEEADAPVEPELAHAALEGGALRPVAGDDERHVRSPRERLQRHAERLLRPEPTGEDEHVPVQLELLAQLLARRHGRNLGGRVRKDRDPRGIEPPAEGDVTEVPARAEDVSSASQRGVPRHPQEARAHSSALSLELVQRAGVPPAPRRAFEHLVGDELHDERPTRQPRADRGAPDHARRVDDVGTVCGLAHELRGPHVPQR